MKKNYSLLLILFVFITNIFSAQTYYYYKGQKQILTLDLQNPISILAVTLPATIQLL